mgnify:FL=1
MHIVTLLLLLAAALVFVIDYVMTKALIALGLALLSGGVLCAFLLHGTFTV